MKYSYLLCFFLVVFSIKLNASLIKDDSLRILEVNIFDFHSREKIDTCIVELLDSNQKYIIHKCNADIFIKLELNNRGYTYLNAMQIQEDSIDYNNIQSAYVKISIH